jgi:hypothetical protein
MASKEEIKSEILNFIRDKFHQDWPHIMEKIDKEVSILEKTSGIDNKNNLDVFYSIWKNNKDKVGSKNTINSWTAYYLGMTSQEPSGDFLPMRRAFARVGFPDIDTDFDYENRDKIYTYIIDKYGRDNVGNIGTHGILRFKSCVTRVSKALDVADAFDEGKEACVSKNDEKAKEILFCFPKEGLMKVKDDDGNSYLIKTFDEAYAHAPAFRRWMDRYPDVAKHCKNLEGVYSTFGCLSKNTPILTNKGWVRIDQLSTRFKIAYIDNNKQIGYTHKFKRFKTGKKKIYRLRISNGSFIDVTDEHLIFTDRGCVPFKNIRNNPNEYKIYSLKKEELEK